MDQGKETSAAAATEKQFSGRKSPSLSSGILKIISVTNGPLTPDELRNFLRQAWNKKKATEIAGHFTADIPALVKQLQEVEDSYHKKGWTGDRMDRDIQFIHRLRTRLQNERNEEYTGEEFRREILSMEELFELISDGDSDENSEEDSAKENSSSSSPRELII